MKAELKNVKVNNQLSEETICFSAALYVEGKKTALIQNRGHGGSDEIAQIFDKPLFDKFKAWVKSLPPEPSEYGSPLDMDLDLYVGKLLSDWEQHKQIKRWSKAKTIFRLKSDKVDAYRTWGLPYSPVVKDAIVKKYGDKIEVIYDQQGVEV